MSRLTSNLLQRQYAAIGKVACEWSHVEQQLQQFVTAIAKIPEETGLKITTELGAVTLLNMILALAHDPGKNDDSQAPIYNAVLAIRPRIDYLRGRRNYYVHRDWTKIPSMPKIMIGANIKAEGKLVYGLEKTAAEDLEQVAEEISGLRRKLLEILLDYEAGRLVASPTKSKRQLGRDHHNALTSSGKTRSSPPRSSPR